MIKNTALLLIDIQKNVMKGIGSPEKNARDE